MPANTSRTLGLAHINQAQAVNIANVAVERGFVFDSAGNHVGPCLHCGGMDRFWISIRKGAFADIEPVIAADRSDGS
jgi:hypothetical protein